MYEALPRLSRRAVSVLQPEMGHTGVTQFLAICRLAVAFEARVMPHASIGVGIFQAASLHAAATLPNVPYHEYQHSIFDKNLAYVTTTMRCASRLLRPADRARDRRRTEARVVAARRRALNAEHPRRDCNRAARQHDAGASRRCEQGGGPMNLKKICACVVAAAGVAFGATAHAQPKPMELEFPSWQIEEPGIADYWTELIKAYEAKFPNVKIRKQQVPFREYVDKMTVRFAGNNPPDIVHLPTRNYLAFASQNWLGAARRGSRADRRQGDVHEARRRDGLQRQGVRRADDGLRHDVLLQREDARRRQGARAEDERRAPEGDRGDDRRQRRPLRLRRADQRASERLRRDRHVGDGRGREPLQERPVQLHGSGRDPRDRQVPRRGEERAQGHVERAGAPALHGRQDRDAARRAVGRGRDQEGAGRERAPTSRWA